MSEPAALIAAARARDKRALGRLISLVERPGAPGETALAEALAALGAGARAPVVGLTGAPGVGKSSLVGALAPRLADAVGSCAVVAVDPSSPISGGAFLGDRVRASFATGDARLFFRSQAAEGALGGLAPATPRVVTLLARLFDLVLVETVGVGQNELDVRGVADRVVLVVAPLAGDRLQGLKAGIVEVADVVCVNKSDAGVPARRAATELRDALAAVGRPTVLVFEVSARTGAGLVSLAENIHATGVIRPHREARVKAEIAREFGQLGLHAMEMLALSFEAALSAEPDDEVWIRAVKAHVRLQVARLLNDP